MEGVTLSLMTSTAKVREIKDVNCSAMRSTPLKVRLKVNLICFFVLRLKILDTNKNNLSRPSVQIYSYGKCCWHGNGIAVN